MNRRHLLLLLAGGVGAAAGLTWFTHDTRVAVGAPAPSGTPALPDEVAKTATLLLAKQGEVNFPLAVPTDLAAFIPPNSIEKDGPKQGPIVLFYLGYKANPRARISFAQTAAGFGVVQPFPKNLATGMVKQQIKLLGSDATLLTATQAKTGANLAQVVWSYGGRTYWAESNGIPTDTLLKLVSSVQPVSLIQLPR